MAAVELEKSLANAVLSHEEKEAGVALIDIGGGTTDLAIFKDGIIRHTSVIPFGGNVITVSGFFDKNEIFRFDERFTSKIAKKSLISNVCDNVNKFDMSVNVNGGGMT